MKLKEFDYELPGDLIADRPSGERDSCRLMVLDRRSGAITHRMFRDLPGYLNKGDCIIFNDTKVMPARIFARRRTGGRVEIFLLEKKEPICEALVRPSGRIAEGEVLTLESGDEAEVLGHGEAGRFVKFNSPIDEILSRAGHMPLPPYISRPDEPGDRDCYQTVYARNEGATASPTAGLHFTPGLIDTIRLNGVSTGFVTLHTNFGTFAPIKCEDIRDHKMHKEYYELPADTASIVNDVKVSGDRVVAVGTTSNRVLEQYAGHAGRLHGKAAGWTELYIYPGYEFKVTDCLITNFHLPCSTLLLLVSAFAGREFIMEAYRKAIEEKYRFFSYGDAMLII